MTNGKDDMVRKVALGAAGLALATGAVAVGIALSNKKNRTALKKGATKTIAQFKRVQGAVEEGKNKFQAFQHNIGSLRGKSKIAKSAAKKITKSRK